MPYISGTAPSYAGIVTQIISGCVANGWTNVGNILYKGNCYVELTSTASYVQIHGGTGQNAGVLVNKSPNGARLGAGAISFPVNYELNIFTDPDEVYLVMNFAGDYYQQLSFGVSDINGAGYGPWITSAHNTTNSLGYGFGMNIVHDITSLAAYVFGGTSTMSTGLFISSPSSDEVSSFIYTNANGTPGWYGYGSGATASRLALGGSASSVVSLLNMSPSYFNGGVILFPIKAAMDLGSKGRATVVSLNNARFCRIDNHNPGDILTFGSERWKIYPWIKKNSAIRNGANSASSTPTPHSGTFAYAIRYLGP